LSQNQIRDRPVRDFELRVPADVTSSQRRFAGPTVHCENPLFSMRILEVADVTILGASIDDGRITTCSGVMISDLL
jgi:hypothetical protein